MPQTADGFFFDLPHTLTGKTEFLSDFLQSHFRTTDAKEQLNNILFTFRERGQRTIDFPAK